MTHVVKHVDVSVSCSENPEPGWQLLISFDEQQLEETLTQIQSNGLFALGERLISIFDAPFLMPFSLRQRAARVVAKLATRDSNFISAIIGNAEMYAREQHIEDAFPYSPNAFEVLAAIDPTCERVTSFLRHVAEHDSGVARWSAAQALREIEKRALPNNAGEKQFPSLALANR